MRAFWFSRHAVEALRSGNLSESGSHSMGDCLGVECEKTKTYMLLRSSGESVKRRLCCWSCTVVLLKTGSVKRGAGIHKRLENSSSGFLWMCTGVAGESMDNTIPKLVSEVKILRSGSHSKSHIMSPCTTTTSNCKLV